MTTVEIKKRIKAEVERLDNKDIYIYVRVEGEGLRYFVNTLNEYGESNQDMVVDEFVKSHKAGKGLYRECGQVADYLRGFHDKVGSDDLDDYYMMAM